MKIFTKRMKGFERLSLQGANMTRKLLMIDILQNDLNVMQVEYNNFEKYLDQYEQQKEDLHAGHLTENTLPITKLQDILDSARGSSYSNVDLEWYYKFGKINTIAEIGDELIFRVFLPFVREEEYNLYLFYIIPVHKEGITM